jgi:hypothetical protein
VKKLILLLLFAVVLTACKKTNSTNAISGKWQLMRITVSHDIRAITNTDTSYNNKNYYIQFNNNSKGTKAVTLFPGDSFANMNFTYSLSGSNLSGSFNQGANVSSFEVSGPNLIIHTASSAGTRLGNSYTDCYFANAQ